MKNDIFTKGDQVQLKTGGPLMTVDYVGDYTIHGHACSCRWFDRHDKIQQEIFAPEILVRVGLRNAWMNMKTELIKQLDAFGPPLNMKTWMRKPETNMLDVTDERIATIKRYIAELDALIEPIDQT
jgi:uncharacterized protein YodC (DUF2158 family)